MITRQLRLTILRRPSALGSRAAAPTTVVESPEGTRSFGPRQFGEVLLVFLRSLDK